MIFDKLKEKLGDDKVKKDEPMSKHTSFKTGGTADIFVVIDEVKDLQYVLDVVKDENVPIFILGNGTNILVTDKGIRGIVCKIQLTKFKIEEIGDDIFVTLGGGNKIIDTSIKIKNAEIEGFEFASGIPGTIGGAVKMNAGAYGKEMKDVVYSTTYMDYSNNICSIGLEEHKFEYRQSIFSNNDYIILETVLKLKKGKFSEIEAKMNEFAKLRKEKQPFDKPSAGSTFKREKEFLTAKLIDECGLKGKCIGGAKVSDKHAGFIINDNNATSSDIIELIKYVQNTVYEKTGNRINLEIEVIGEK